ncbi:MAG: AraC family transcriptional regulator [Spirochaetaceae bacterium]
MERLVAHTVELYHRQRFRRITASSLAHLLFEEIRFVVENLAVNLNSTESSRFERITGFIRENLDREISLDQLCDLGAVSLSTLRRLFLKSVGVSPYEWILQARIERARYLLRTTSEPISQISLQIGFEDPSYFVRLFHKREGQTPHRYRVGAFKI